MPTTYKVSAFHSICPVIYLCNSYDFHLNNYPECIKFPAKTKNISDADKYDK